MREADRREAGMIVTMMICCPEPRSRQGSGLILQRRQGLSPLPARSDGLDNVNGGPDGGDIVKNA